MTSVRKSRNTAARALLHPLCTRLTCINYNLPSAPCRTYAVHACVWWKYREQYSLPTPLAILSWLDCFLLLLWHDKCLAIKCKCAYPVWIFQQSFCNKVCINLNVVKSRIAEFIKVCHFDQHFALASPYFLNTWRYLNDIEWRAVYNN